MRLNAVMHASECLYACVPACLHARTCMPLCMPVYMRLHAFMHVCLHVCTRISCTHLGQADQLTLLVSRRLGKHRGQGSGVRGRGTG